MTEIIEETKGLDAKMLAALASTNQANAALTNAVTNQQNVDVQREKARVEARKNFRSDVLTTMMKPENEAAISTARKADKDAGIKLTDPNSQERKVRNGIESDLLDTPAYKGLLTREDVGIAPAPAPAPKKDAAPAAPKSDTTPPKPKISEVKGAPKDSSVGSYVAGKGWEIKGSDGKLLGYSK